MIHSFVHLLNPLNPDCGAFLRTQKDRRPGNPTHDLLDIFPPSQELLLLMRKCLLWNSLNTAHIKTHKQIYRKFIHCHPSHLKKLYLMASWLILPCIRPQTLCALFRGVHQKNKSASGFDIINMLMGFDKAEQRMKVRRRLPFLKALSGRRHNFHSVTDSCAGPDGETGRPPLWGWFWEFEESLPETAAVFGDGEELHVFFIYQMNKTLFLPFGCEYWLTKKHFDRWRTILVKIPSWSTSWSTAFLKPFYRWLIFNILVWVCCLCFVTFV